MPPQTNPAGGGYDPSSQTPYTPPQLPEVQAPPPTPAAGQQNMPSMQPGPQVLPNKGGKAAGIAYMASSLLKGIAQGRSIAEVKKVAQAKKQLDGLSYSYQIGAGNLRSLIESGADPNSKEVQQARAARDASWQAMMGAYGQYLGQGDKKPKKSSKSQSQSAQPAQADGATLMQDLASPDPQTKMQAIYKLTQKLGPPDEWNNRQYLSQQAVAQREAQKQSAAAEAMELDRRVRRDTLEKAEREGTLDEKGKQELDTIRSQIVSDTGKIDKKIGQRVGADNHLYFVYQKPDGTTEERDQGPVRAPVSQTKPIRAWALRNGKPTSVELDPQTNQIIPGTENDQISPPVGMLPKIRTSEFGWTDGDGKLHRTQTTATTTPVLPSGGSQQPSTKTKTPLSIKQPPTGDHIIGDVGAKGQAKSRAEAADSVLQLLPKAQKMLEDPKVREQLGALNGRWSEVEKKVGTLDPKVQEFYGTLKSIYALNGSMHGWRSLKAPEEFEKAYGDLHTDPDTLLGGLKAVEDTAKDVYQTGFHHPYGANADDTEDNKFLMQVK